MNLDQNKHIVFSLVASGLFLVGLLLLLNRAPQIVRADPGDLFVKPDGSGTDCSQASPCALQTALDQASDGDTIYVAGGTYTGAGGAVVTVTKSITLYGGWDGAPSGPVVRDPDAYPTILDGEGTRRVVYISGPVTVTLEGLTVANGKIISTTTGWDGAGLYARDAALTVRHTNFYSNVIDVYDAADSYAYGGGMMVEGGSLFVEASAFRWNSAWAEKSSYGGGLSISGTLTATVMDTLFQDNDAWHASGLYFVEDAGAAPPFRLFNSTFRDNGLVHSAGGSAYGGYAGAIEILNAQAQIADNLFHGNRAANDYGTVYVYGSSLALTGNVITGNQCARTAGLYLSHVSPFTATNNIIAGNRSTYYWLSNPAASVLYSSGGFLHNTIARNRNDSGNNVGVEYGVLVDFYSTVSLTNTILASHTVGISVTAGSTATLEGTLWGSGSWANGSDWGGAGTVITGTVNTWGDPAFVDPDGGDYHLGPGSAAINAGVDAGVTTDIDGDPRPIGAGYDIGADEYVARVYLPLVLRNS